MGNAGIVVSAAGVYWPMFTIRLGAWFAFVKLGDANYQLIESGR